MEKSYLSEFEHSFELNDELPAGNLSEYTYELDEELEVNDAVNTELDDEFETDDELDGEFEIDDELDNEFEIDEELDNEFEIDDELDNEMESDDELETDYPVMSRDGYYDRDREYSNRIYNALTTHGDNELEFELELDTVLHEMEKDYFFGAAKKWLKKKGLAKLKKYAMGSLPLSGALKAISALGRGDIRSLLKSKLLQSAAQFIPGAGPAISKAMSMASGFLNDAAGKQSIQNIVQMGKDAYQQLAGAIPAAENELEVRRAAKRAFKNAVVRDHRRKSNFKNSSRQVIAKTVQTRVTVYPDRISINRGKRIIPLSAGSVVSVRPSHIIIWKKKA